MKTMFNLIRESDLIANLITAIGIVSIILISGIWR